MPGCTANFTQCGIATGQTLSTLTGWHTLTNVNQLGMMIDEVKFEGLIEGILEGFGNEDLMILKSNIAALLIELPRLEHDVDAIDEIFTQILLIKKEIKKGITLPELDATKIGLNFVMHMNEMYAAMSELETCETSNSCGLVMGGMLKRLLN
jgi:hypothetical protein